MLPAANPKNPTPAHLKNVALENLTLWERKELERIWDDQETFAMGKLPRYGSMKYMAAHVLDSDAEYVLQECDCTSTTPQGLAAEYLHVFPYADPYGKRRPMNGNPNICLPADRPVPGDIEIFEGAPCDSKVVAMFVQVCPGPPYTGINKTKRFPNDSSEDRRSYFRSCLKKLGAQHPDSIALPQYFGCRDRKEEWDAYCDILDEFADEHHYSDIKIFRFS